MSEIEIEKVKLKDITLIDLFNKSFIDSITDKDNSLMPVTVVLMPNGSGEPIILSHESPSEFKEKILHIQSKDIQRLQKIIKTLSDKK